MRISMNPKLSGFRKWTEIREPTKMDKARTRANKGGIVAATDVHQATETLDQQPHRPWFVPGPGKL